MATDFPPDGWPEGQFVNLVWGTDADHDDVTFLTGESSIRFFNTTPAFSPTMRSDPLPVEAGSVYEACAIVRADSTTAGDTLTASFAPFDAGGLPVGGVTAFNGVVNAANTWERYCDVQEVGGAAVGARLALQKKNTAFNGYFDRLVARRFPPIARLTMAGTQDIVDATWTPITNWDASPVKRAGITYAGTETLTIVQPGFYHCTARMINDELIDEGDFLSIRANVNAGGQIRVLDWDSGAGASDQLNVGGTALLELAEGDVVRIEVRFDGFGANRLVGGSANACYWDLLRIGAW